MLNPNLKHLRIFVEIARRGSFRNAANAMHLSEPATSQAITQLETLLGVKLLDRTTRIVRISEAGSIFLEDAVRLLETMDYSIASLKDFAKSGRGRVTIACLSSAVYRLLPPVLAEMKVAYPEIDVVFLDDNMKGILQKMDKGECDIAIVSENTEQKLNISIPLLDDVFQHRSIKGGLNIIVSDFNHLYFKDVMLPAGTLREFKSGINRADIIIVSKVPEKTSAIVSYKAFTESTNSKT